MRQSNGIALTLMLAVTGSAQADSSVEEGRKLANERKKGNCLACHQMDQGADPGNIGPPLIMMKQRFPDKTKLRAQIWDAAERNPHTIMPRFGRYDIMTDEEIDKVTDYIYTL